MPGEAEEVSLLSAAALSSLMQSDDCPPLVLEAVMGHSSSGHAFIPGAVLFSLSEVDVCLEDETGSPLPIAGNYCLRGPTELRRTLERHGVCTNTIASTQLISSLILIDAISSSWLSSTMSKKRRWLLLLTDTLSRVAQ